MHHHEGGKMCGSSPKAAAPIARRIALAAALTLGGCASPYVTLDKATQADDARPRALAEAIGDARATQGKYRAKVIELGEIERTLSNSLLGLGTLIVGLGVAKVHS